MQVLSFVNAAGPEAWKNGNAKRFVRSHAMKDFRRKQREQKKRKTGEHTAPGESSFVVASLLPERLPLPDQEVAQAHAAANVSGAIDIPSPTSSIEKYAGGRRPSTSVGLPPSLHEFLDRVAVTPPTCSVLPQIFPLQDVLDARLPSPAPSASSDNSALSSTSSLFDLSPSHDFDLSVCKTVYGALDQAGANFEQFTKHYFRSVHSYLTIINRKRFLKRVQGLSRKANAESALLLLCIQLCAEPTRSGITAAGNGVYITAKTLFQSISVSKKPSVELVQAGALLALFEHNTDLRGPAYQSLRDCSRLASVLGLDAQPTATNTVVDEERRRLYWGLLSLDCTLSLHDEKHKNPLLFSVPSPDNMLPSVSDSDYEDATDEMPAATTGFLVQSKLPKWADSFSRQGQAVRLLYMVLGIVREKFDTSPDLMISRIEHLDSLVVSTLGNLLADCNGKATQYCFPISCCITASYLLHEYQLLSTMHSPSQKSNDTQAPTRSKLAIETMIEMMVNILREFPVTHTPELGPLALWCPYKAAMLGLLLDRISGLNRPPTLVGTSFELMVNGLRHFSTIWPCTAQYIKAIERAQSRALPIPATSAG